MSSSEIKPTKKKKDFKPPNLAVINVILFLVSEINNRTSFAR